MSAIQRHLDSIEATMRTLGLWAQEPPLAEQLASQLPFACDTLPFEQWLQFILLPKMQHMVAQDLPLPDSMAVAPAAEVSFAGRYRQLTRQLAELDSMVNDAARNRTQK